MLNLNTLQTLITQAFEESLPLAIEQGVRQTYTEKTEIGDEMAKKVADTITNLLAEPLGKRIASAIDYYVHNIDVFGTIITTGTPVTQTAIIESPSPITNGIIPNTFGIK